MERRRWRQSAGRGRCLRLCKCSSGALAAARIGVGIDRARQRDCRPGRDRSGCTRIVAIGSLLLVLSKPIHLDSWALISTPFASFNARAVLVEAIVRIIPVQANFWMQRCR